MERRVIEGPIEVRAQGDGKARTIVGYAAVFNSLSQVIWGFREKVAPGAFAGTLGDDVRALWNHDPAFVLGRTRAGTLSLAEDEHGLRVEITPPATPLTESFLASIERGDVSQMSFGFRVLEDTWDIDENDEELRTLLKVKLYEVSPVTFPAYTETEVSARSAELLGDKPERPERNESDTRARAEIEREDGLRAQADERIRMEMQVRLMEVGDGHR